MCKEEGLPKTLLEKRRKRSSRGREIPTPKRSPKAKRKSQIARERSPKKRER